MGDFQSCIAVILAEEGGLSQHRRDPGGLTKYGISQRSYPELNIAALTKETAITLYRRDYWAKISGDDLPPGLDLLVLDCAINQGVPRAALLLQEALSIPTDTIIGPVTLRNAQRAMPELMEHFCALRAWRYEIDRNEDVFGKGWFRRLFRVFVEARKRYERETRPA